MTQEPLANAIERLPWDSQHYGRPVARLRERAPDPRRLEQLLERARDEGVWLLYWLAEPVTAPDPALLARFGELRVAGYVRYALALADASRPAGVAAAAASQLTLAEYRDQGEDQAAVIALGVAAGAFSRFRADPRLPAAKCDALYERWIRRSIAHELADDVLVARGQRAVAGLVTASASGTSASIGLLATSESERGRGVARALLAGAVDWASARGCTHLEVATQRENVAACRLYERAGYRAVELGEHHHFMLGAE